MCDGDWDRRREKRRMGMKKKREAEVLTIKMRIDDWGV